MIEITQNDCAEFEKQLGQNLHKFNVASCEYIKNHLQKDGLPRKKVINFRVADGEHFVGGCTGYVAGGWYYLDMIWFDEKYRRQHIGTRLLKLIEEVATKERCIGIYLWTFEWQAKDFYIKHGYSIFGEQKDFPPGYSRFYMQKLL